MKHMRHKKWNKLIKMINSNQFHNCKMPAKTKRNFKIVTWNEGSSHFKTDNDKFLSIKTEIKNKTGDIVILSEAECNPKDETYI